MIQTTDKIQQRGFTAARRTDNRGKSSGLNGKRDIFQCYAFDFAGAVAFGKSVRLNQNHRYSPVRGFRTVNCRAEKLFISIYEYSGFLSDGQIRPEEDGEGQGTNKTGSISSLSFGLVSNQLILFTQDIDDFLFRIRT